MHRVCLQGLRRESGSLADSGGQSTPSKRTPTCSSRHAPSAPDGRGSAPAPPGSAGLLGLAGGRQLQERGEAAPLRHRPCQQHIVALDLLADRREQGGQGIAETVKKAASSLLGFGAAAVDFVRDEKLPKNLRDDYAAVSLACIGYVMLHTTGLALNDEEVAELAHQHLQNHAKSTMSLHNIVPVAVIRFLQEEGHAARKDVLPEVARNIQEVWGSEDGVAQTEAKAF